MPSRTPRATLAATSLALACSVDDDTPPTLEHVAFADPSTLRLRFSEPLASVDDIDPSSHFRLSAAFVLGDRSIYYDVSYHFESGGPDQQASGHAAARHGTSPITGIEPGADAGELLLTLAYPLEHYVCDELAQAVALEIPAAMRLHYAHADYPRVTDEAGNELAQLGAWWVGAPGILVEQPGALALLELDLPIACP